MPFSRTSNRSRGLNPSSRHALSLAVENLECRLLFNNTPVVLSQDGSVGLLQDWSNTALFAAGASNTWDNVPGIIGYQGLDGIAGNNAYTGNLNDPSITAFTTDWENTPQVKVPTNYSTPLNHGGGPTPPAVETAGELAYFTGTNVGNNNVVAYQGSGTADFPNLLLFIDASAADAVNVSFKARDVDGSADNTTQQVVVQYRIGNSGSFTNVNGGYIADATTGPNLATKVTSVSCTLPGDAAHQPGLQIRIMTTNASSTDEF